MWYAMDDRRLPVRARQTIEADESSHVLSVASAWEIVIKYGVGKWPIAEPAVQFVDRLIRSLDLEVLPVSLAHAYQVSKLPIHHNDPFDRLLVAQAQVESLPIVTGDPAIARYGVQVIW
jgi:PIN domain nuclease of toxin-antitoxin system